MHIVRKSQYAGNDNVCIQKFNQTLYQFYKNYRHKDLNVSFRRTHERLQTKQSSLCISISNTSTEIIWMLITIETCVPLSLSSSENDGNTCQLCAIYEVIMASPVAP